MPDFVPEFARDWPVGWLIAFLFVVVFCRSHATYWIGRGVAAGAVRSRWSEKFTGAKFTRARESLAKWGWPIVPLSYLTIGFQTAVMAVAGLVGMKYGKFLLASLPGCVVWAVIYGVGGLAVFLGAAELALRSPWLLVAAVLLLAGIIGLVVWRRRSPGRVEPVTADEPA